MSIEISTTNYEFSHGKKPRGYGKWAFFFDGGDVPLFFTGKFSEAKRMAIAYAVGHNFSKISVAE